MRVYSLYDRKVREYGQLVLGNNDEAVVRALGEALRNGMDATVARHPEDFDLMCLGDFDEESGELVGSTPLLVVNCFALMGPAVSGMGVITPSRGGRDEVG